MRIPRQIGRSLTLALLLAAVACVRGEIIDRVVATVDRSVITLSGIELNLRLAAFVDGRTPELTAATRKAELDREIDQALLREEMDISHFSLAPLVDAMAQLDKIKAERFPQSADYDAALAQYSLTDDDVQQYLQWQITVLRFIDFRFRPGVQVDEDEVLRHYREVWLPEWLRRNANPAPAFDDVRSEVEQSLVERETDAAVERWLAENRKSAKIRIVEEDKP